MVIDEDGVHIEGADAKGVYYGKITLYQLMTNYRGCLPYLYIYDEPKYHYRGFMIDSSRHFFTVQEIKKMIDGAVFFKLNKFHFHLSDDLGFRVKIDSYPKLTEVGSVRKSLFSPEYVVEVFSIEPAKVRRGILHTMLHCLYLHPFRENSSPYWHLACDMAVEQIICREESSRLDVHRSEVYNRCMEILGSRPRSAEEICRMGEEGAFPYPIAQMEAAFFLDDHRLWQHAEEQEKWEHLLTYTVGAKKKGGGIRGNSPGKSSFSLENPTAGAYDYSKFLQQFSVPREEMELDMDSFDYIYYNLGLNMYGNMPLLEPLEYREGHKLEQLVIAIDTSGSCSPQVVASFLGETYSILSRKENFFRTMEVMLVQCDCLVQSAVLIHSREEWMNYSREITISGRGGTDFTPVFRFVEERQREGMLRNLKALLYFTDGDGCYPRVQPLYETAFVFLEENEHIRQVPPWARILLARG